VNPISLFVQQSLQTGVAISFLVRRELGKKKKRDCKIHYVRRPELETSDDKLAWLSAVPASAAKFEVVKPDAKANWINQTENDWDDLLPVSDKKTKAAKVKSQERAIFKLDSLGVVTARDDWVTDRSKAALKEKVNRLVKVYESSRKAKSKTTDLGIDIKWSRAVKADLNKNKPLSTADGLFGSVAYRAFSKREIFYSRRVNEMIYKNDEIYPISGTWANQSIVYNRNANPFWCLSTDILPDYHFTGDGVQLPRHRYTSDGEKLDNITDWAFNKFTVHYGKKSKITKDEIFAYVYAVLHDPIYRETYAINLKREFPRIPFYPDFHQWRDWGQTLLDLHIGYETVKPFNLKRTDVEDAKAAKAGLTPKVTLKADKDAGTITLDSETTMSGIPPQCWDYKLGNRSGLEWVLDQYKEKTPKDPTIRAKFNTYRFADYKEDVVDLLKRVTRVSVETMQVTEAMKQARR